MAGMDRVVQHLTIVGKNGPLRSRGRRVKGHGRLSTFSAGPIRQCMLDDHQYAPPFRWRLLPNAIMRDAGASKTSVWNWPKRFIEAGVEGLLRDKLKKPGKAPLADAVKAKVVEMAAAQRPENATHWSLRMRAPMASARGASSASLQSTA